ncbi:phenylalanine--tRNA ligase subunit beta [Aurantivibrio plasticivorans]
MKLSESWLREWVSPDLDTQALADQITMAGLEVDGIEPVAGEFTGVIVGEIVSAEQHPDADKLRVCSVSNGSKTFQVVCGAPNARVGIKVPFATVGALLPGNFKIKKAKLRGVESFGMLCAQTELKAGDDDSGLWELPVDAPAGADLQEYLKLNDRIIEVDLTPNRGDCLSMRGIAREVGVLNKLDVTEPQIAPVAPSIDDALSVTLEAAEQCPRYIGRVVRNVDVSKPTPLWMQERLRRAGVRPHDCIVDITNYVLLEQGQPMHAFDLDKLNGSINVRLAKQGEEITLLDGQDLKLNAGTLLITDEQGPVAAAGVMGGERSSVSETTKNIFFESAFFSQLALAGQARSYGLHTDASHRYERGVDYELPVQAMERATQLLLEIAGGEAGPLTVAESAEHIPSAATVTLRRARILSGLGFTMDDAEVVEILTRLGLTVTKTNEDGWELAVPSYRFDISIEEDLLEELARIYGYNRLPTKIAPMDIAMAEQIESNLPLNKFKQALVARDYHEAISYSFISEQLNQLFNPESEPVKLINPISAELSIMRASLIPGLVNATMHNLNRQQGRIRLFETGMRFVQQGDEILQEPMLAGLITGSRVDENWASESTSVDFFDLKGDVEALLQATGEPESYQFKAGSHPALHPGQTAEIIKNDQVVGVVGALHPQAAKELDINQAVFVFEITQSDLLVGKVPDFAEISKFPEVRRDIAVLVDKKVQSDTLLATVEKAAGSSLSNLKVFDLYVGKGIDPQRKSVALGLTFQDPSRTLTESEINASMDAVIQQLKQELDADLR